MAMSLIVADSSGAAVFQWLIQLHARELAWRTIAEAAGTLLARLSILHLPPCIGVAVNWVDYEESPSGSLICAPVPEVGDNFTARGYGLEEDRFFGTLDWIEWGGPDPSRGHYRACVRHNGCWWAVDDHKAVKLVPDGRPWRPALVLFLFDREGHFPSTLLRDAGQGVADLGTVVAGLAACPSAAKGARTQTDLQAWLRPAVARPP